MAQTSTAHHTAMARCRRWSGVLGASVMASARDRRMANGEWRTVILPFAIRHSPFADLQLPHGHVAAQPDDGGHVEGYHQRHERQGDGDRAHPAPALPVLLAVLRTILPMLLQWRPP